MSSSWGLTEIVLEGGAANDVYALLSRAKEECASEDRDHCSQVIHTVKETVVKEDVFMLFPYPFDSSSRYVLDVGRIE